MRDANRPDDGGRRHPRGIALALGGILLTACAGGVRSSSDADISNGLADAAYSDAGLADGGSWNVGTVDAGTVDAGSADAGTSDAGDAGTVTCGCHGMAGCAVWSEVYITWYGYNDNSCGTEAQHGCNDIANPGLGPMMHMGATAGAGTYDDPSTAASSDTTDPGHVFETAGGATLTPGTLIYNPEVQQYFIFEDSCLECGDEYSCKLSADDTDDPSPPAGCQVGHNFHIDFWMGPNNAMQPSSLQTCEDNATLGMPYGGLGSVIVNPPPDLPVKTGLLYPGNNSATGGCFTSQQVGGDSCP